MIKEAMLYNKLGSNVVECSLCAHHCNIANSKFGLCNVRQNKDGKLYTHVYGEVIASHADPIEKKPLYHFHPGTAAYSIAMVGCNFRCGFCQNWQISQLGGADAAGSGSRKLNPKEVVQEAKSNHCRSIAYTYTEPTIFFEYAYDTAKLARDENIYNIFVTNGYMSKEALEKIYPFLDACNVDLKSFSERTYKEACRGSLKPVLNSIRLMKELGIWIEITTLVIPDLNDSDNELKEIANFIASVDKQIPWHISRFHPDYKYLDALSTPTQILKKAVQIGRGAGLSNIYIGNIMGGNADTICCNCSEVLVKRSVYVIEKNSIKDNKCPKCNTEVAGVWK